MEVAAPQVPSGWKGTVVDGGLSFADPVSGPVGAVSVVVTPAAGKASIKVHTAAYNRIS